LLMMILNIIPDHFSRYFVSYCPDKIPVLPKFSSPKLFLYLWMILKNYTRTNALQHPHYLSNTIPRWKGQKYMNVIPCYLHRINLKIMVPRNLLKNTPYSFPNVFPQNPFSILRGPYQMILRVIDSMTGSFQVHMLNITHLPLPTAVELFIPVYKTGYSSSILHKFLLA